MWKTGVSPMSVTDFVLRHRGAEAVVVVVIERGCFVSFVDFFDGHVDRCEAEAGPSFRKKKAFSSCFRTT